MPYILLLVLLLMNCHLTADAQKLDSLQSAIVEAVEPEERLWSMIELMRYYRMRNNDSTLIIGQEVNDLAQSIDDYGAQVVVRLINGGLFHSTGQAERAFAEYYEGLALAKKQGIQEQLGPLYQNLGLAHRRGYHLDSAFYYFIQAEEAFLFAGEEYDLWRSYWGLAEIHEDNGELDIAEEMILKALAILEKKKLKGDYGFFLYNLYAFYFRLGNYDQMAMAREKWRTYQETYKTSREIIEMPEHMALSAFLDVPDSLLIPQLMAGIIHYDSLGNTFSKGWCYEDLGDLYLKQDEWRTARQFYSQANETYQSANLASKQARVLQKLYQIDIQLEQYPDALAHLLTFQQLTDSLFNEDNRRHLQQLQVAYETEKKEQALRINQLELGQKTQERNVLLGSSIFLGFLLITIFLGLRIRLRTNQQLALQEQELQQQRIQQLQQKQKLLSFNAMIEGQEQERIRIAKDLHDGLGGLLTTIKAHFSSLSLPASQLQDKTNQLIDTACIEVRRISQNMMPTALLLSGLSGALEDLTSQLQRSGLDCHLELMGIPSNWEQTKSVMLYRVVQELTNNILKHAKAKQVLIQLIRHQEELTLIVEDDGQGFDWEQAQQQTSIGLKSIDSRVRYLLGNWDVDSVLGEGTTVTVRFSL